MWDYEVQRPQFFYRKSLSCKWLEMGASLEKVVLFMPRCSGQPNGHAGFGADLPGCWHPVTTFVPLWGSLWGIYDPSDLLNIFDIWQLCLICSLLPLLFQMSAAESNPPFSDEVYNLSSTYVEHCFSRAVDSSVLKFVFRSKIFEKVTCCFSLFSLEFYSELTYKIIFQRST